MSEVRDIERHDIAGVSVTDTPEGLSAIHRPDCAAAIWRRQALPSFQSWIDGLGAERLPKARVILPAAAVRNAVFQICEAAGTPDGAERERLIDDAAALANLVAELIQAPFLRLCLDVVTTEASRESPVDADTARLICTYRGTGTQYGISTDGEESRRIFTVPTGAPILLRGPFWPTRPKRELLHRSTPIARAGETRLVLALDPIMNPGDVPGGPAIH